MFDWGGLMERLGAGAERAGFKNPETGAWNTDRIGMTLGQIGAALAPVDSWQNRLGNVVAGMGMSNIYANAAAKERQARAQFADDVVRALGGLTPKGTPGPTSYSVGADGVYNVKGELSPPESGGGNFSNLGSVYANAYNSAPSGGAPPPQPQPQGDTNYWSRFLGSLSPFQDSSARLTSADYAGLTPEQIQALATTELRGQESAARTMYYLNNLLGPKPAEKPITMNTNEGIVQLDPRTGQWVRTGYYPYGKPTTLVTSEGIKQWAPETGQWAETGFSPYVKPSTEKPRQFEIHYRDPKTEKESAVLVDENNYNSVVKSILEQGFEIGSFAAPQRGAISEIDRARIKARGIAFNKEMKEEDRIRAVSEYNSTSPDSATTFLVWKSWGDKAVEKKLPRGKTMGEVRALVKKYGVTLDEYLRHLSER